MDGRRPVRDAHPALTAITVIAVGRLKAGPVADLLQTYRTRLAWPVDLIEVEGRSGNATTLKTREAEAIREKLPSSATIATLDERGKAMTSPDFAKWIEARQLAGTHHLAFILGGADGLDAGLRAESALSLAFGAMTWPHMLARVLLFEQLYRAQQILAGHPYHRV